MQVTIAMRASARDVVIETDLAEKKLLEAVQEALSSGTPLDLTDTRGRRYLVPADAIGMVEIGSQEERKVGFGLV